jgi:hypothetical protein
VVLISGCPIQTAQIFVVLLGKDELYLSQNARATRSTEESKARRERNRQAAKIDVAQGFRRKSQIANGKVRTKNINT